MKRCIDMKEVRNADIWAECRRMLAKAKEDARDNLLYSFDTIINPAGNTAGLHKQACVEHIYPKSEIREDLGRSARESRSIYKIDKPDRVKMPHKNPASICIEAADWLEMFTAIPLPSTSSRWRGLKRFMPISTLREIAVRRAVTKATL